MVLPRRASVRVRLTALYGAMFFLAGAAVVVASHALVSAVLTDRLSPVGAAPVVLPLAGPAGTLSPDVVRAAVAAQHRDVRDETLASLLVLSTVALGAIGVAAVGSGWLMAGRVLRPLHRITATARRVADRDLHRRSALDGPDDELKELADTFDEMLERLDRAFDGQRRFVADASHELRTPLAITRTLVEVALADEGAPEGTRRLGETLLEVNHRHERLIDGLLVLAQSDNGLAERVPVDLAAVAAHVVGGTAGDGLRIDLDAAPAPLDGDPVLLERMVANVVDNAVRHNVDGGEVAVRTGSGGGCAWLEVANTGPVVPDHAVPGLFEPFRRLVPRVGRGAGLGLSIVRSVAAAHGGTASARPRDGGGLTVRVELPSGGGRG
jgi:signal transduction histidine kinase